MTAEGALLIDSFEDDFERIFSEDVECDFSSGPSFNVTGAAFAAVCLASIPAASAYRRVCSHELSIQEPGGMVASTACVIQGRDESESGGVYLPSEPNELVGLVLHHTGLVPDRVTEMPEGSHLFEFSNPHRACVEVYPTGEIVVVVKQGERRDLYEFDESEVSLIAPIIKNGLRERD